MQVLMLCGIKRKDNEMLTTKFLKENGVRYIPCVKIEKNITDKIMTYLLLPSEMSARNAIIASVKEEALKKFRGVDFIKELYKNIENESDKTVTNILNITTENLLKNQKRVVKKDELLYVLDINDIEEIECEIKTATIIDAAINDEEDIRKVSIKNFVTYKDGTNADTIIPTYTLKKSIIEDTRKVLCFISDGIYEINECMLKQKDQYNYMNIKDLQETIGKTFSQMINLLLLASTASQIAKKEIIDSSSMFTFINIEEMGERSQFLLEKDKNISRDEYIAFYHMIQKNTLTKKEERREWKEEFEKYSRIKHVLVTKARKELEGMDKIPLFKYDLTK